MSAQTRSLQGRRGSIRIATRGALIGEAVSSTFAWDRLAVLTDDIGNRSGSTASLDRAIQWAIAE
jgi:hypothetical protein